jgi:hypothetical protein
MSNSKAKPPLYSIKSKTKLSGKILSMTKEAVNKALAAFTVHGPAQKELAAGNPVTALNIIFDTFGDQLAGLDENDVQALRQAAASGTTKEEVAQHLLPYLEDRYGS